MFINVKTIKEHCVSYQWKNNVFLVLSQKYDSLSFLAFTLLTLFLQWTVFYNKVKNILNKRLLFSFLNIREQSSFYFIFPSSCVQGLCEELLNKLKAWAILSDQNDQVCREFSDARYLNPESEVCLATKSLTNWPSPHIRCEVSLLRSGFVYKKIALDEHYVFLYSTTI